MVSNMDEGWSTENDEESLYFIEVSQDKLMLVIETHVASFSCVLERNEVESLVEFLSEWTGYPVFLNDPNLNDNTSYGDYS